MNLSNEFPLKHRDEFNETFIPTREAGLKRLKEFAPLAGEIYSNKRNFDFSSIKKNSVSDIQNISKDLASVIIESISGDKLNESSIKAAVEDITKKKIGKYL